jgi:hypothetical protein
MPWLMDAATMGQGSQVSNPSGWTRSDVIALVTLLIGVPAAIVAAVALTTVAKRRCVFENSKLSFAISFASRSVVRFETKEIL